MKRQEYTQFHVPLVHKYVHLFPDGSRAIMTVWINRLEKLRPATLQGRPLKPELQGEFVAWTNFISRHIEDQENGRWTKALRANT